jgi:hypothetical protein
VSTLTLHAEVQVHMLLWRLTGAGALRWSVLHDIMRRPEQQLLAQHMFNTQFLCMPLQIKFVPFNPTDKYTIGTIRPGDGSETFRLMKGAPQARVDPVAVPFFGCLLLQ